MKLTDLVDVVLKQDGAHILITLKTKHPCRVIDAEGHSHYCPQPHLLHFACTIDRLCPGEYCRAILPHDAPDDAVCPEHQHLMQINKKEENL